MEEFVKSLTNLGTIAGGKLLQALVVLVIGKFVIGKFVKLAAKSKAVNKMETTVKTFALSLIKIALWVVLLISVIEIIGIPMTSVVAVLASAGVAVGLALQGALSNVAGGIMIILFRPFKAGDYIDAAGVQGTVKAVTIVYTVLVTVDNKRITIPNGSLMNANVINYSAEENRRVDLSFKCGRDEHPAKIQKMLMDAALEHELVLKDPVPFARISTVTNEGVSYDLRAWSKTEDYWTVYHDLLQAIMERFAAEGISGPSMHFSAEKFVTEERSADSSHKVGE